MGRDDRDGRYNRTHDNKRSDQRSHNNGNYKNKRKHDDRDKGDSTSMGVGSTLSFLQQPDLPEFSLIQRQQGDSRASKDDNEHSNNEQEAVEGPPSKKAKKIPKRESSNYPSITFSSDSRLQSKIKISDLQALVLYLLADGTAPQWVSVRHRPQIRKTVVLMIPGLEESDFKKESRQTDLNREHRDPSPDSYYPFKISQDALPDDVILFADMFEHLWPVRTPGDDKYSKMHSPLHAMLSSPLPKSQDDRDKKGTRAAREPHGWQNRRTPVTEYLSTVEELLENEYTVHPAAHVDDEDRSAYEQLRKAEKKSAEQGWVDTHVTSYNDGTPLDIDIEKGSITAGREILAMDCEMVKTGEREFSLTRISIVNWEGTVIMDELVKPDKPIIDYLTMYSGMTEDMLAPVTTTLKDIQQKLLGLLHPKTILIGHSLNSDLTSLKLTHPFIIDTALLYPHPRGPPLKSSLKYLAQRYLSKEIQKGHGFTGQGAGHDSIEDARTCLDLVKQKCEKGPQWGTSDSAHENLFKRLARTGVRYKNQGESSTSAATGSKLTAAVDWGNPKLGAGNAANFTIGCKSDDEVIDGIIRAIKGDSDGLEIPGGGVDFVWARMRELEALRGWWNTNKVIEPVVEGIAESIGGETASVQLEESTTDGTIDTSSKIDAQPISEEKSTPIALDLEAQDIMAAPETVAVTESRRIDRPDEVLQTVPPSNALLRLTTRIKRIYDALPPCTALILYSGSGDPREMSRLQQMQQTYRREFKIKKWDELSVQWTDTEEQALKKAAKEARNGLGFITVK